MSGPLPDLRHVQLVATSPSPDTHGPQNIKNGNRSEANVNRTSDRLYKHSLFTSAATSNKFADDIKSMSNTSENELSDQVLDILWWLKIVNTTLPSSKGPADYSTSFENEDPSMLLRVPKSLSLHDGTRRDPSEFSPGRRARRQITVPAQAPEDPPLPVSKDALRQSGGYGYVYGVKRKVLGMMLQSLYSAQERLWPLEPIVKKYEHLTPYRMAFIFMKLDQLVYECHSIYMYLEREKHNKEMTMTRRLQLYSHLVRRNVDITYLVDYITERVPRDQVVRLRQWLIRQEQEALLKKKRVWDSTTKKYPGRPQYN